jgi:hypothetical protein
MDSGPLNDRGPSFKVVNAFLLLITTGAEMGFELL